ncbi:putative NBD/HSP70 family sugar kinase [Humibacillus xanthopallidus]|uniref:Putative NBD/HSP70 family sugar kinase n=1 Tax=Humibacillus xanthopallidus TaxID=412689 RepID=A0A543PPB8_9MICO|nr:ROK family transcriptional regulator [Humibacillus xanthopallidus]TQN45923.1 putative NBD/HSP70 family sugar kinase [Humibacillus xanthopallidus]
MTESTRTTAPPAAHPGSDRAPVTGARQALLRETNLALVVSAVLGSPSPRSRADVAGLTGMTRSTVSRLVDELVAGGLLVELAQVAASRPGRPATPLAASRRVAALGLQVNAGSLAATVVALDGTRVAEAVDEGDFVDSEPGPVLARLGRLARATIDGLPSGTRLVGCGLALPGIVSIGPGVLLRAPNLGWSDVRPCDHLSPEVLGGLDLRLGNEADLAALTVAQEAPGRPGPLADFIYLSGEIGIGGAAVVDGRVMTGRHGWAGEIGHVCVDPDGPACPCGSTGCLERYAGRHALLEAAGMPHDADPTELAERIRAGDVDATAALDRAAWALATALAGVVNVLDLPVIVLGGHLGRLVDVLRPRLEPQLSRRVLSSRWLPPTIEVAGDDPAPGATGAALAELAQVVDHPARWL